MYKIIIYIKYRSPRGRVPGLPGTLKQQSERVYTGYGLLLLFLLVSEGRPMGAPNVRRRARKKKGGGGGSSAAAAAAACPPFFPPPEFFLKVF